MATSAVGICNDALLQLGQPRISALSEDNERARACNERYDSVRQKVLALHPWKSATKRTSLTRLVDTPAWGFTYYYGLPTDYVRLAERGRSDDDYRIESTGTQRAVATDQSDFDVTYVYDLQDVTKMEPLLQDAIAALLASELTHVLRGSSSSARQEARQRFQDSIAEARFIDAVQGPVQRMEGSELMQTRMGDESHLNTISAVP